LLRIRNGEMPWQVLDGVHRASLVELVRELSLQSLTGADLDRLVHAWHHLPAWPDSAEGMSRFRSGSVLTTLSNVGMAHLVDINLAALLPFDCVLSTGLVRLCKLTPRAAQPAPRHLRRGNLAEALLPGGDRPALAAGEIALSHDDLRTAASGAARRLIADGVTQGTHVALFAENSAAWIVSYLGLQLLGATVVGMNPAFKEAEAEQILTDSEAAVALVDAGRQPLIDALRARLPALRTTARVEEIGSIAPFPRAGEGRGGGSLTPESPAILLYTSGTTGS